MRLYHITSDLGQEPVKTFIPRVPTVFPEFEDSTTPRVCLCPSIEECILAVNYSEYFHRKGALMRVYSCEVTAENKHMFLTSDYLMRNNMVSDAFETHEVWCIEPITMNSKCYAVVNIDVTPILLFEFVRIKDIINALQELGIKCPIGEHYVNIHDSEWLYNQLIVWFKDNRMQNAEYELFKKVATACHCKSYKIENLKLHEVKVTIDED